MKIATVGLIALVLFLSTVTARADSSEYIQGEDGCWYTEGPSCVAHDGYWDDDSDFISWYHNNCALRILLKSCHQANKSKYGHNEEWIATYPALENAECEWRDLDPTILKSMITFAENEPTGRVEFRWIGSTIAENDGLCANKSGVNEWWPNW